MFSRLLTGLATLLIFAVGLFFLLLALGGHLQLLEARRLMSQGELAVGTVTAVRGGGYKSASYYFSYEFPAGTVMQARKDSSISYRHYTDLRQGTKVEVRYDPTNPENSITAFEMAELESWPNRLFLPAVGLALLGWGVVRIVRRRGRARSSEA